MLRRNGLVIIAFAIIILGITIPKCFAIEDNPEMDTSSITISRTNVTVGDEVKVSMRINGTSNHEPISIYYFNTTTHLVCFFGYLEYDSSTDLYEATTTITKSFESGEWKIFNLIAKIDNNNYKYIDARGLVEEGKFSVYGTTVDTTPPIIDSDSLIVSKTPVEIGDILTISIKITDDISNPFDNNVWIYYKQPKSGEEKAFRLFYNSTKDCYEKTLKITDSFETGTWEVSNVYAEDMKGNYIRKKNRQYINSNYVYTLNQGNFKVLIDSDENKAEYETINELENVNVYDTETSGVYDSSINGDVYIGPDAIVTFRDVEVNGDIYVLGGLDLTQENNFNQIHAKTMGAKTTGNNYQFINGMYKILNTRSISQLFH